MCSTHMGKLLCNVAESPLYEKSLAPRHTTCRAKMRHTHVLKSRVKHVLVKYSGAQKNSEPKDNTVHRIVGSRSWQCDRPKQKEIQGPA